jgi:hypothetical protein
MPPQTPNIGGNTHHAPRVIEVRTAELTEDGVAPLSDPKSYPLAQFVFQELCDFHGVVPPLQFLNEVLVQGQAANHRNRAFFWHPFQIDEDEYQQFRCSVLENPDWGGEIDDSFVASWAEWGHWAFVRSLSKLAPRK